MKTLSSVRQEQFGFLVHGVVCAVAMLCGAGFVFSFWDATIDDAFISLRYAENLVQGEGLVFNPGERVEGFSNLLWTLLLAFGMQLGFDPVLAAKVLGLVSLVGLCVLLARASLSTRLAVPLAVTGIALILSNPVLQFHAIGGLETIFFAALVFAAAYGRGVERPALSIMQIGAIIALIVTRPEGIAYAILIAVLYSWSPNVPRRRLQYLWSLIFMAAAALTVWRYFYYGSLIPNTFFAKTPLAQRFGASGVLVSAGYVAHEIAQVVTWIGGILTFPVIAFAYRETGRRWLLGSSLGITAVAVLFEVYAGGDWMRLSRFLVPMYAPPLLCVICGLDVLLRPLSVALQYTVLSTVIAVFVIFSLQSVDQFFTQGARFPYFVLYSTDMRSAARAIKSQYPKEYRIACWRIGALAFEGKRVVINSRVGLTEPEVAHLQRRGELTESRYAEFISRRRPELYLEYGTPALSPSETLTFGQESYRLQTRFPQGSDQTWDLYLREDLVSPRAG